MVSNTLSDAAFGAAPGCWPLPPADGAGQLWLRAVAAGGQGRYASARTDLAELLRRTRFPGDSPTPLVSLAMSTRASFLRQLGWHWLAHRWDGQALATAGDAESGIDALLGLAADALGVGRLAVSAALLRRADALLTGSDGLAPRLAIRRQWVGAELAMAGGDGATALTYARRGAELADLAGPDLRRHRVKSDVVLAAALCSAGDTAEARRLADTAIADAESFGLTPLRWALACLLSDIGSARYSPDEVASIRARSAAEVTVNGGSWRSG